MSGTMIFVLGLALIAIFMTGYSIGFSEGINHAIRRLSEKEPTLK